MPTCTTSDMASTFVLTIGEFSDLEVIIGMMDTDSRDDLVRLTRDRDGYLRLGVEIDGESSTIERLDDWAHGISKKP